MALIQRKPTSAGRRFQIAVVDSTLYKGRPVKKLTKGQGKSGGRGNNGRISVRHIGGGHKRLYRAIDFKRNKYDVPALVERLEYDPNRSANIALLLHADGERTYILAPKKLKVGDRVITSRNKVDIRPGNCTILANIPLGTVIHNIELRPNKGAQLARSAGVSAQMIAKEGAYVTLRLASTEMRKVLSECFAVIGEVGNSEHNLKSLGKAGAKRWRGVRPTVRGVAMNPVDHPHGGGEGKTSGGRHPVSPWGQPTKGFKTRKNQRSSYLIVRRRKSKK